MKYNEFAKDLFYATEQYIADEGIQVDENVKKRSLNICDQIDEILTQAVGKEKAIELLNEFTNAKVEAELPYNVANFCAGIKIGFFMARLLYD